LKGSLKIEIEEALENKLVLKETLGSIVIPLERKENAEKLMEN
jgi:hypothetical protein